MSSTATIVYPTSNPIQFNSIFLLSMSSALVRAIDISNKNKRIDTERIGLEYERLFESERKTSCEHVFKWFWIYSSPASCF